MPDKNKKSFDLILGKRGSFDSDPVTEIIRQNRAEAERKRLERQDRLDELKAQAEEKELQGKLSEEDKQRMAELENEVTKTKEELAAERQRTLENKIEESQKQILAMVQGDPKVKELESKVAEGQVALAQERLDQLKAEVVKLREGTDINKELEKIEPLMEKLGYKKEGSGGMPPDIWLRIKQMELDQQREALEATRDREDRKDAREFEKLKWAEEREDKKAIALAEVAAKKDGNALLADGIQKLAELVTAIKPETGVAGKAVNRPIDAGMGESGEVECVKCHNAVPISADSSSVTCPSCGTSYPVNRMPKMKESTAPKAEAPV